APFLGDKRLAVQQRAIFELAHQGEVAVPALKTILGSKNSSDVQRVHAVWALCQMDSDPARGALRGALEDPHSTVRQAATSSVALHRDWLALEKLKQLALTDPSPSIRREAANALGRIGESQAVATLLEAWGPAA